MPSESVEVFDNRAAARDVTGSRTSRFAPRFAEEAAAFHRSIPGYSPTALHPLPALAASLGVSAVWVKDESTRFGLNAFKGLGASYAVAGVLAGRLERDVAGITFGDLTSPGRGLPSAISSSPRRPTATTAAASPGRRSNSGRRPRSSCPPTRPRSGSSASGGTAPRPPSPTATTTTPCASSPPRRKGGAGC